LTLLKGGYKKKGTKVGLDTKKAYKSELGYKVLEG